MSTMSTSTPPETPITISEPKPGSRKAQNERTLRQLQELCHTLKPGDRLPLHTELMRRFGASERSVLRALDDMQRVGRLVRRPGAGTFIAEGTPQAPDRPTPASTESRTVVAITRPDGSIFDRCMELLFRYAEEAGLSLVCQPVDGGVGSVSASLVASVANNPLGFILFDYTMAPLAQQLQEEGWRAIVIGAPPVEVTPNVPCIYNDHEYGGFLVTSHLIGLGHRRISFLLNGTGDLMRRTRWLGHQRALRMARRSDKEIQDGLLSTEETALWERDISRAADYFARPDAPTAIVAWNDHEAVKLFSLLTRAGVKVPEQVSLVGYDALPEGELIYPRLTTVDHNIGQQLRVAVDLLCRATPPPPTHSVVLVPSLVVRQSTAPPADAPLS